MLKKQNIQLLLIWYLLWWQENYIAVHTEYWEAFRFFLVFFIELIFPQDLSLLNLSMMDRFQEKQSMCKVKWALKPNTNMLTFKDVSLCRVQSRPPWTNGSQGEWWSDDYVLCPAAEVQVYTAMVAFGHHFCGEINGQWKGTVFSTQEWTFAVHFSNGSLPGSSLIKAMVFPSMLSWPMSSLQGLF